MRFDRLVLVDARTVTALNRLLDAVSLIQADHRVQIVFTADPRSTAVFRRGVREALTWARSTRNGRPGPQSATSPITMSTSTTTGALTQCPVSNAP